jgi:signal transduction histidine kinase
MSSELQPDEDLSGNALPPPENETVPLIFARISDGVTADARREVRLNQLGAMVAIIVHDLRQYIAIVKGVAELLQEGLITGDTASMLLRAAETMTRMTQDILEFARGVDQVTLTPVPVQSLLAELDDVVLRRLEGQGIRVHRHVRSAGVVHCDRDLLMRALVNFVTNAGEAMPDGGELALTIEDTHDAVVVGIQDTGRGIPNDVLPSVFEPFITHGKRAGTGLGLAIARDIVRAHGGSIGIASTVGLGTTVIVTLPRPHTQPPGVT